MYLYWGSIVVRQTEGKTDQDPMLGAADIRNDFFSNARSLKKESSHDQQLLGILQA
jgi:hypothetical protein